MTYKEIKGDLFDYARPRNGKCVDENNRIPVHCISSDFVMGGGIAVPMAANYGLRTSLKFYQVTKPSCLFVNGVMNLITKKNVYDKPTYRSLTDALTECRSIVLKNNVRYLVMPKIGCGLDGLEWSRVSMIIRTVFADTNVDILVCVLE